MKDTFQKEFEELPEEVQWHIQRCDGFLDLKMPDRARTELEVVPASQRDNIFYEQSILRLTMEDNKWNVAVQLAEHLCDRFPDVPQFWIHWAYATRRIHGLEAARIILQKAAPKFPKVAVIPFNIACYECQLGRHEEAKKNLNRAFKLDSSYRDLAMEDDDLQPLWNDLEK